MVNVPSHNSKSASSRGIVPLRALREAPLWRLLAADSAPVVIPLLKKLLLDAEKVLVGTSLQEQLDRELALLRAAGDETLPNLASHYMREWLEAGWLVRRLPAGSREETYELSTEAAQAVRFIAGLEAPRAAATESRLATVIAALARLAEETDTNQASRLRALEGERERLDREIALVRAGRARVLEPERALERAREILALSSELTDDFRRVRDEFESLNRSLRAGLLDEEQSRGEVLGRLFEGFDVIAESDAGKTFAAFWRLLTDVEQAGRLDESLAAIAERPFARSLTLAERRYLLALPRTLLGESSVVNDSLQVLARGLKRFVQSREYLETRRIAQLIRRAEAAARDLREHVNPTRDVGYTLELTSLAIRSVSQWVLDDPQLHLVETEMSEGEPAELTLDEIHALVQRSEIDFRTLEENIREALRTRSQVSLSELLELFPATQGLGSVVGLLHLAARMGEITDARQRIEWTTMDGEPRAAFVPAVFFLRDKLRAPLGA